MRRNGSAVFLCLAAVASARPLVYEGVITGEDGAPVVPSTVSLLVSTDEAAADTVAGPFGGTVQALGDGGFVATFEVDDDAAAGLTGDVWVRLTADGETFGAQRVGALPFAFGAGRLQDAFGSVTVRQFQDLSARLDELERRAGIAEMPARVEVEPRPGALEEALASLQQRRVPPGRITRVVVGGDVTVPEPIRWTHPDGAQIELVGSGEGALTTLTCPLGCFEVAGGQGFGGVDRLRLLARAEGPPEDAVGIRVSEGGRLRLGPHPRSVAGDGDEPRASVVVEGFDVGVLVETGAHLDAAHVPPGDDGLGASYVEIVGTGGAGLRADGGATVSASGIRIHDCSLAGGASDSNAAVTATGGAMVVVDEATIAGCYRGVVAGVGAVVSVGNASVVGMDPGGVDYGERWGIASTVNATVSANRTDVDAQFNIPVFADQAGYLDANQARVTLAGDDNCFVADGLSVVHVGGSVCEVEGAGPPSVPYRARSGLAFDGRFLGNCVDCQRPTEYGPLQMPSAGRFFHPAGANQSFLQDGHTLRVGLVTISCVRAAREVLVVYAYAAKSNITQALVELVAVDNVFDPAVGGTAGYTVEARGDGFPDHRLVATNTGTASLECDWSFVDVHGLYDLMAAVAGVARPR